MAVIMPTEQRWLLEFLVPLATWLTGWVTKEKLATWLERGATWLLPLWMVWPLMILTAVVVIPALLLFMLWRIPERIATRKQEKAVQRQKVLQTAVQPVPSRKEMATRFATVLIVVWLGLSILEQIARRLDYCLLDVSDTCGHTAVNDAVWLTFAAAGGLIAIWRMLQARSTQAAARRQLVVFKMSPMSRFLDTFKLVISAIVAIFLIVVILAVAAFLFDV